MEEGPDGTPRRSGAPRTSVIGHVPSPKPAAGKAAAPAAGKGGEQTTTMVHSDEGAELQKVERPDDRVVTEIVGCLKVRVRGLGIQGSCERQADEAESDSTQRKPNENKNRREQILGCRVGCWLRQCHAIQLRVSV